LSLLFNTRGSVVGCYTDTSIPKHAQQPMIEMISTLLVTLVGIYVLIGILVALPFILRGAGWLDPAAAQGSAGFRILILPGAIALWPLLLWKWAAAVRRRQ